MKEGNKKLEDLRHGRASHSTKGHSLNPLVYLIITAALYRQRYL